ncbi:MAG: aquaporin, partial [Chloroflexota bacterium]
YMGGHISDAHYNPAVTLAAWIRNDMSAVDALWYLVAQMLAALLASVTVYTILGETFAPMPNPSISLVGVLLVEILFTFALVLVILNVAKAQGTVGNGFYGIAIGFTVIAIAYTGGGISGGAYNPAVGLGPAIIHTLLGNGTLAHTWLYLLGPFAGGVLATAVFWVQEDW